MPLKRHHKIMIGSLSSFLIVLLIVNSIFIYILFGKLQYDYNKLDITLQNSRTDFQVKFNEITANIIENKKDIINIDSEIGSIGKDFSQLDKEFSKLKASTSADFSGIVEDVVKSIVTIKTNLNQGTGFLIDEKGYVITNHHIMENAVSAGIYTYEGESHQVKLIGEDKTMDLILLKIEGNFEKLDFIDKSEDVSVGEKVIAIGNPLGLQFSVSEGIVSAIHRKGPNNIEAYIQTDAALNPGNSGGPLINKEGNVIGINNFKISSGESLGFALESDNIKETINNIAREKLNITLI